MTIIGNKVTTHSEEDPVCLCFLNMISHIAMTYVYVFITGNSLLCMNNIVSINLCC